MFSIKPSQSRIIWRNGSVLHPCLAQSAGVKRQHVVTSVQLFRYFGPIPRSGFSVLTQPKQNALSLFAIFVDKENRHFQKLFVVKDISVQKYILRLYAP